MTTLTERRPVHGSARQPLTTQVVDTFVVPGLVIDMVETSSARSADRYEARVRHITDGGAAAIASPGEVLCSGGHLLNTTKAARRRIELRIERSGQPGLRDSLTAALPAGLRGQPVEDLLGIAPEWDEQALCAQTDPEVFFPEKGGGTREAKRICRRCPVRTECLRDALDRDERFGVWGGLTERERRKLKRRGLVDLALVPVVESAEDVDDEDGE